MRRKHLFCHSFLPRQGGSVGRGCASPLRAGPAGGLEADPQTRTERPADMALLFFRGHFAGDLEGRIAGDAAEAADPAARAIFGNQGKGRAVLERRRRRAEVAADDLAATTFEFEARPTVIFVGPAELETHRDAAGNSPGRFPAPRSPGQAAIEIAAA